MLFTSSAYAAFLIALSSRAWAAPLGFSRLLRRQTQTGTATFYEASGQGSCQTPISNSGNSVALSNTWMNGQSPAKLCGSTISVTAKGSKNNGAVQVGKTITATVDNTCPECDAGHIDLDKAAFLSLSVESNGIIEVEWSFNGGGGEPNPNPTTPNPSNPSTTDPYGSDVCGCGRPAGQFRGCNNIQEMCAKIKANSQPLPPECQGVDVSQVNVGQICSQRDQGQTQQAQDQTQQAQGQQQAGPVEPKKGKAAQVKALPSQGQQQPNQQQPNQQQPDQQQPNQQQPNQQQPNQQQPSQTSNQNPSGTDIYGTDICGCGTPGGQFRGCANVGEMCAKIKVNGQPLPPECQGVDTSQIDAGQICNKPGQGTGGDGNTGTTPNGATPSGNSGPSGTTPNGATPSGNSDQMGGQQTGNTVTDHQEVTTTNGQPAVVKANAVNTGDKKDQAARDQSNAHDLIAKLQDTQPHKKR